MSTHATHDRWAGFRFQSRHMFTPEGHHLEPTDMVWWVRPAHQRSHLTAYRSMRAQCPNVTYRQDALLNHRERRLTGGDHGPAAEPSNVIHMCRGPTPRRRG